MNIKVIYSSGGEFSAGGDKKVTDDETIKVAKKVVKALKGSGHLAKMMKISPEKVKLINKITADAVFNLCEWTGKDSHLGIEVLKRLEDQKIPYTGATSESDLLSCSKIAMKEMFDKYKILTPNWVSVMPGEPKNKVYQKVNKLSFPIIIKPAFEHCGIGIGYNSVIRTKRGFTEEVMKALSKFNEPVVVEEFIEGREFTTTIIKNHEVHVFPPAEVIFNTKNQNKILSFETKWHQGKDSYGAKILEKNSLSENLKKKSKKIFNKLVKKGYVRIDFRVRNKNIYALEFNVNPSLLPEECYGLTASTEAAGWSFEKLVNEIANSAATNDARN